ncbi:MAG: hypothetical protein KUG65_06875 [Sphingomonadaceae bacterium]|nr:hypothetical protein [Sphingomonadaceae bacterium]
MSRIFYAAIAACLSLSATAMPAAAQTSEDKINQLIVFGEDPCPVSTADLITVCARKDETERFRIPEILRQSQSPENDAWNNRVLAYEAVLDSGTLSCSPSGPGGWTGCTRQMIQQAYAEKETDASLRFGELIAEQRAKRLATIDDEAEAQQEEVEAAEREYFEEQAEDAQAAAAPE